MELSEILNSLSGTSGTEKTASANNSLSDAIDAALNTNTEKTASHNQSTPAEDLVKIAQDISNAEQDALLKEAHLYGRAVADGFAARMSQYEVSNSPLTKTSSINEQAVKEAMELGYLHATNALRNSEYTTKEASYSSADQGFEKQASMVKEAAYASGSKDAVKVAGYLVGQEDAVKVANDLLKVAHSYENFGFKVGNSILRNLQG